MIYIIGKDKDVAAMWTSVKGFLNSLELFRRDLTGEQAHFKTVKTYLDNIDHPDEIDSQLATNFISKLITEFSNRFKACNEISALIDIVTTPCLNAGDLWREQLSAFMPNLKQCDVELDICDFSADSAMKAQLSQLGLSF